MENALSVAVLISGGGTTLKNLIDRRDAGDLPIEFKLVISSKATAAGLGFAAQAGIPSCVIAKRDFNSPTIHSEAVFDACRRAGAEMVIMGGYLEHLLIPPDFENRVINIHPSLIPSFCGKGMYGFRVHQAAVDFGVKVSGCTVHFVDNQYDHGPILLQRACEVLDGDTAESLQQRVSLLEREALPDAIRMICRDPSRYLPNKT